MIAGEAVAEVPVVFEYRKLCGVRRGIVLLGCIHIEWDSLLISWPEEPQLNTKLSRRPSTGVKAQSRIYLRLAPQQGTKELARIVSEVGCNSIAKVYFERVAG